VAGFSGGVKQTSGKAHIDFPSPALHDISRPLANTLLAMEHTFVITKSLPTISCQGFFIQLL
jgi:hypothetical protein